MTHKEKVNGFIKEAQENGYDRPKIRRVIEHNIRELANNDTEKFDIAAYAMIKSLGIKLKGVKN